MPTPADALQIKPKGTRVMLPTGEIVGTCNPYGARNVAVQDQTTPALIIPIAKKEAETYITVATSINDYDVTVNDATGFTVGRDFGIINVAENRFYQGTILGVAASVLTLDTPLDFAYPSGVASVAMASTSNMAVNGSVTPVTFKLRLAAPSLPAVADITHMIITCIADTAVDLSLFGDLAALTNGCVLRIVNGITYNIVNVKTNQDLAGIGEWSPFAATNPAQGVDGFRAQLNFAGQHKIGVALRIAADDNFEFIVQDDLSGLVSLKLTLLGHVTED